MPVRLPHARIAVLCHAAARRHPLPATAIYHLAEIWRNQGLEVVFAFGVHERPEADLALLHVDLSVVPDAYARLADRYPIVLNGRILDVRKSTLSANLLSPRGTDGLDGLDGGWDGPVIVKTDLNAAGRPERRARPGLERRLRRLAGRWGLRLAADRRRRDAYRVFASRREVPRSAWRDPRLVVERFLPEETALGHAARSAFVLGGSIVCERSEAPSPIVCDATAVRIENVAPHPALPGLCLRHRLDYGKLDYTVRAGACVPIDVNKTVGASRSGRNQELRENRRLWAAGLHDFLEGRRQPA